MNVPKRNQLVLSAFAEIVLIALSYLLMLVIAVLCVALPVWGMIASGARFFLSTAFLSAVGASISFSILRSLWPREAPVVSVGIPLDLDQQSDFKEFLSGIATSLNQQPLQEVGLVTNAAIYMFETGGALGFGSRRCVAIGLPLFAGLSVAELRAVVAHEFVRSVYSGETRQATNSNPSRAALALALDNLSQGPGAKSWLARHPFGAALRAPVISALQAYWKVFLRTPQALSRQRTYWADEVSCHLAGSVAVQQSLQSVERIKAADRRFWPK